MFDPCVRETVGVLEAGQPSAGSGPRQITRRWALEHWRARAPPVESSPLRAAARRLAGCFPGEPRPKMMPSSPSRRRARPVLCALGAVLAFLLLAPGARAAEPDYSGWKDFLKKYLIVLHQTGKPLDTRFDYEQLYVDEGIWTKHRSETLDALHTQLLSVDPSDMTRPERTAWAINAYNFLVIERMTLYLLVPGRKFMRFDSPRKENR